MKCWPVGSRSKGHKAEPQILAVYMDTDPPQDISRLRMQLHRTRGHRAQWSLLDGLRTCRQQHRMELELVPLKMMLMDWLRQPPQWPHWTGFEAPPTAGRRVSPLGLQCRDKWNHNFCYFSMIEFYTIEHITLGYIVVLQGTDK